MLVNNLIVLSILSGCALTSASSPRPDNKNTASKVPNSKSNLPTDYLPTTPEPCPRYPVIFLHGLMGGSKGSYKGVAQHFESLGCKVRVPDVAPVNSSEFRGTQLAGIIRQYLVETGAPKVNIVAHSQGGLDARYAVSKLGLAGSVATLSMLSTPNYGSPLADLAIKDMKNPLSKLFLSSGLGTISNTTNSNGSDSNDTAAAMKALSTTYMNFTFNPNVPDVPGVLYQSWAARTGPGMKDKTKLNFSLTQKYLAKQSGENDGMVAVESAKWGEFRGILEADHLDITGTKLGDEGVDQFDHLKFLDSLLSELRSKGF